MKYIRYGKIYDTDKIEKVFKLEIQKEDPNNNQIKFRTISDSSNNSSIGMTWGTTSSTSYTSAFTYPTDYWINTKSDNYIYEHFIGKTPNNNYVKLSSASVKNSNGHNVHVEDKIFKFYEKIDEIVSDLSYYYGFSDLYDKEIEYFIRDELKFELPEA